MPRRLRNDAQELLDDTMLEELSVQQIDREFAAPYLRHGSLETWPMWVHNSPEYMTGVLGDIVPMDDIILLARQLFDFSDGDPDSAAQRRRRACRAQAEKDRKAAKAKVKAERRARRIVKVERILTQLKAGEEPSL